MFKDNQEKLYIIIFLAMLIINDFEWLRIIQTVKQTTNRLLATRLNINVTWIYILGVGIRPALFLYAIMKLFKSKSRIIISSLLLDLVASFFYCLNVNRLSEFKTSVRCFILDIKKGLKLRIIAFAKSMYCLI